MSRDLLDCNIIKKLVDRKSIGYIILIYLCHDLKWINLRSIFISCLIKFGYDHLVPSVVDVIFAWCYHNNLTIILYKPAKVFKKFSFVYLMDPMSECSCLKIDKFYKFLSILTKAETLSYAKTQVHVCTTDVSIIQHFELQEATSMGLNHILLKPTNISISIVSILDAFAQFSQILSLDSTEYEWFLL